VLHAGAWSFDTVFAATRRAAMALDHQGRPTIALEAGGIQLAVLESGAGAKSPARPLAAAEEIVDAPADAGIPEGELRAWPLPNRGASMNVAFAVPQPGPVDLAIYDLAGRRVRALVPERAAGGASAARWDGHDERGGDVQPGVYFLRLQSGAYARQLKVVRVP
jgi:hypothetical protein